MLTCSPRCRVARYRRLRLITPAWPERPPGGFDLFNVDLPLRFTGRSSKGERRSPQRDWPDTDIAALIAMRKMIDAIAARDAVFNFWVYGVRIPDLLRVIEGWGLTFKGELLCWVKTGNFGSGLSTRKQVENSWYATRGRGLKRLDKGVGQLIETVEVIEASRGEPSEKPEAAYHKLVQLYGGTNRIDLFARKWHPGWTGWGNEAERPPGSHEFGSANRMLIQQRPSGFLSMVERPRIILRRPTA